MSTDAVFGAFSVSLLIAAAIGPRVGRTIDEFGGRAVLMASNVFFAAGLTLLAASQSWAAVWAAWLLIGFGMGLGLYDAAFAALSRIYGTAARGPITGITLMAGNRPAGGGPIDAA